MSQKKKLTLHIEQQQLDSFCRKIISRSRNTAGVHEALTVLEAFVSAFSSDSQGADNYRDIQQTLKSYSAKTRDRLMQEKTQQLTQGLISRDIVLLTQVHSSLSRNGFYQILGTAIEDLAADKVPSLSQWAIGWAEDARQKAEQASGYPDALDFVGAAINIEQYQAMSDIAHFFTNR